MPRPATPPFDCLAAMRALGEPTRLRLVRHLIARPCTVSELCDLLQATPYNVSKHLRVLRNASLLDMEKDGQHHIYSLAAVFRRQLAHNGNLLDLGCCQFHFDRLPD